MALATSGALTLDQIHVEAGGTTGTTCSLNDSDIRGLTAASGKTINSTLGTTIDFDDFYGASSVSTPASFGKTNVTAGTYSLLGINYAYIYWNEKYRATSGVSSNDVNVFFNETSDFLDSSNNTQAIIAIQHTSNKSPNAANLNLIFLNHNVSTSSWTLSYAGVSITGNSGFTYSGITYGSPTVSNITVSDSNSNSYNATQFTYLRTSSPTHTDPFPSGSGQSWTVT